MITILTPSYNRAYILPILYKSLINQKSKQFEWLVVDDGSEDGTKQLVEGWMAENNGFDIKYIRRNNGGKHRALNTGIPYANYDYIYIIDSDDSMTNDAVELINEWIVTVQGNDSFAGVSGLKERSTGELLGKYPSGKDFVDATNLERRRYGLLGDKAEVYRKDLLIQYPFPEFDGEKFLSEAAVWDKIAADGYKIRWFGKAICVCEYLDDGLTKNLNRNVMLNNFCGYTYVEKLNAHLRSFPENLLAVGRYIEVAKYKGIMFNKIQDELGISKLTLLGGLMIGFIKRITKIQLKH